MRIVPVPVLQDNYSWLVVDETDRTAAIVDCAEVAPVLEAARAEGVRVTAVLSTHHHFDHVGGNEELARTTPVRVYGNADDAARIPALTDGVRAGDRVLEVGCGWGALAEMATVERGASVTGVTLSTEQLAFAQERLARQGVALAGAARETAWRWPVQADLRLQDYRDIDDGPYDAVCSIEMIEAVGREYWPTYFETLHRVLKPGGRACIQSITIDDALYERYIRSTDFIQQYVFPGGCLPSPSVFEAQARAAGFEVIDRFAFGPDYGRTLALWREAFLRQQDAVRALGFDTRFMRIWEFYLCYCEAGFAEGDIDVMQFTLQRA